jgi:hypothetical protein
MASPDLSPEKDPKKIDPTPAPSTVAASAPSVAPRPSFKAEGMKAFITTAVAILLTPLTVSVTFFLTAALQSPKPSIEETSVAVFYEPIQLGDALRTALTRNPNTAAHLRRAILMRTGPDDPDCVSWMTDFLWVTACAEKVRGALGEIADEARAARQSPVLQQTGASNAILQDIHAIETLENEIDAAENVNLTNRNGNFEITVGVYNSGSSDGVVKSLATFYFEGKQKKVTLGTKKWVPVKSHSFEEVAFSLADISVTGEETVREELERKIKNHEEIRGNFEINMSEKTISTDVTISNRD